MKLFAATLFCIGTLSLSALDYTGVRNARNLLKEKRFDEAAAACCTMAEKTENAKDRQFYVEMGIQALMSAGNKPKAAAVLDLLEDPMRRSFVYMKFSSAEEIIERTGSVDFSQMPEDIISDAHALRGMAFLIRNEIEKGLADLKKSLEYPGGSLTGASAKKMGDTYAGKNDENSAEFYYSKAVSASPGAFSWRCQAIVKLSEILIKKGNADKARSLYSEDLFLRAAGNNKSQLYASLAKVLQALNQESEALIALENAIKFADDNSRESLKKQLIQLAEEMM